jgi:flagella basal body P-ring formation protein FlgA
MISRLAFVIAAVCFVAGQAAAASLVAAHAIPARSIISAHDVRLSSRSVPGALVKVEDAVGMEARVTIYTGRPVRAADIGPPALIKRNEIVRFQFSVGVLVIEADGRALARGGEGDMISVMNLSSRSTVIGRVTSNGMVEVAR